MKLSLVTRSSVLQAITECDELTREPFLLMHGFDKAREYFLLYKSKAYDSKAIVGAAYERATGERLTARDFSGGQWLADRLEELGFEVTGDMDWRVEEQILACDLLCQNSWKTVPESDPRTSELSTLLRSQWPYAPSIPEYRGVASVHRKVEDLRTAHPNHTGVTTRGGTLSRRIAAAFVEDPEAMHVLAEGLRQRGQLDLPLQYGEDADPDPAAAAALSAAEFAAALEGKAARRLTRVYERNPKLRRQKIAQSRKQRGGISCEVCGFDYEQFYPGIGEGYVHVHHVVPLHVSGPVENALDDLALLCANCHGMIHKPARYLTLDELRAIVASGMAG
ncbi:HNH endonuclease [Nocardia brasiliensis]